MSFINFDESFGVNFITGIITNKSTPIGKSTPLLIESTTMFLKHCVHVTICLSLPFLTILKQTNYSNNVIIVNLR